MFLLQIKNNSDIIQAMNEGEEMAENIIGAAVAALAGIAVAYFSFLISKKALKSNPEKYLSASLLRLMLQIALLAAIYFIAKETVKDVAFPLIGGALGVTLPGFYLTGKLLNCNSPKTMEKGESADG